LFADTLQLSAYTAQESRLAHRRTPSKRGKVVIKGPMNPGSNANLQAGRRRREALQIRILQALMTR